MSDDEARRDLSPLDWIRATAEAHGLDPDAMVVAARQQMDQAHAWQQQAARAERKCSHQWTWPGSFGDEWRECFLCGRQEDA